MGQGRRAGGALRPGQERAPGSGSCWEPKETLEESWAGEGCALGEAPPPASP